jgi:hypothetical protein
VQCCGSGRFILDPESKLFSSRIRVVHPGCSSRIRILVFYPSRIPDPGIKKAPDPGSATLALKKLEDLGGILRQTSDEEFSVVLIACCGRLLDLCTIHSLRHFPSETPLELIILY